MLMLTGMKAPIWLHLKDARTRDPGQFAAVSHPVLKDYP